MTPTLTIEAAGRTHVGLVRQCNEDALYVGQNLVAVADGMGGHVGGDVASATVLDAIRAYDRPVQPVALAEQVGRAVVAAGGALRCRVAAEPALRTMGSTLVALAWSGPVAVLAHIGDSRAYRLRGDRLVQMTEDHIYDHLVAGADRVPTLPARLSRFLDGRRDGRSADITMHELRPGDRWLLCSDGLSSCVPHEQIHAALAVADTAREAADRLVALALGAGGPDNVTVVLLDAKA